MRDKSHDKIKYMEVSSVLSVKICCDLKAVFTFIGIVSGQKKIGLVRTFSKSFGKLKQTNKDKDRE